LKKERAGRESGVSQKDVIHPFFLRNFRLCRTDFSRLFTRLYARKFKEQVENALIRANANRDVVPDN